MRILKTKVKIIHFPIIFNEITQEVKIPPLPTIFHLTISWIHFQVCTHIFFRIRLFPIKNIFFGVKKRREKEGKGGKDLNNNA